MRIEHVVHVVADIFQVEFVFSQFQSGNFLCECSVVGGYLHKPIKDRFILHIIVADLHIYIYDTCCILDYNSNRCIFANDYSFGYVDFRNNVKVEIYVLHLIVRIFRYVSCKEVMAAIGKLGCGDFCKSVNQLH